MFIFLKSSYEMLRSYYSSSILFAFLVSLFGFQASSQCFHPYLSLACICVIYSSLFIHSSVSFVSLCYALFRISSIVISLSHHNLVQIYSLKLAMFISSYILSFKLSKGVKQGLNVSYLIHLYKAKMSYLSNCNLLAGSTIGIHGRILSSSNMKTKIIGLCICTLSLYHLTFILDYGYIQLVSNLGEICVKARTLYHW